MANIWDEVEEIKEVQNTPQQQPTNDIWSDVEEVKTQPIKQPVRQTRTYPNQPIKNMTEEEFKKNIDKIYDIPQVDMPQRGVLTNSDGEQKTLTGGIEQKVIPNWDKKGRIYYTDEQGNRIKSNVPLSRKIGNQLKATGYNIKDWLTTDVGEKAKERRKAVAMGVITAADLVLNQGRGLIGNTVGGGVGSGLYSLADQAIEGKFNPKQLAIDAGLGAGLGLGGKLLIDKAIQPITKNIARRTNIAKRRATPLADRMTEEQLERHTRPETKPSQYGVSEINTEQNKAIAEQMQKSIQAEEELLREYKTVRADLVKKYGSVENLKAQAVKDLPDETQYGMVSDAINDYRNLIAYEQELGNARYISTNIKPTSTREGVIVENISKGTKKQPVEKVAQQPQVAQQLDDLIPEQVVEDTAKTGKMKQSKLAQKANKSDEVAQSIQENPPLYEAINNAETIAQAQSEIAQNADKVHTDIVKKLVDGDKDFSALDVEKTRQLFGELQKQGRFDEATELLELTSKQGSKLGQAVQAFSLWSKTTPDGAMLYAQKLLDKYNKGVKKNLQKRLSEKELRDIGETFQKLNESGLTGRELEVETAKAMKKVFKVVPKTFAQKLDGYRYINMLLSPQSRIKDFILTAKNASDTAIDESIAGGIDYLRTLGSKDKTRYISANPFVGTKAWLQGAKKGFKEGLEDVRYGINTSRSGEVGRYGLPNTPTFKEVNFEGGLLDRLKTLRSNPLGSAEKLLRYTLQVPDRMFFEARYASSLANQMKARGVTEPTQDMINRAVEEAKRAVFQEDRLVTKRLAGAAQLADIPIEALENVIGLPQGTLPSASKGLAPFVKTPTNVIAQGAEGLHGLGSGGLQLSKAGNNPELIREAELLMGRGIRGLGELGLGYAVGKGLWDKIKTNIGEEDYYKNEITGLQPSSLVIGDKAISLQNMQNNLPFFTGAGLGQRGLGKAFTNTTDIIAEMPALKALGDLYNINKEANYIAESENPDKELLKKGSRAARSLGTNYLTTLIPVGGWLGELRTDIDPYARELYAPDRYDEGVLQGLSSDAEYLKNRVQNRIPGLSMLLPNRYNSLGQPIMSNNIQNPVARVLSQAVNFGIRNYNEPPSEMDEMQRIQDYAMENNIKGKTTLKFAKPKRYIGRGKDKTRLTNEQYSELTRLYNGKVYDELQFLMNTPEYQSADEETKIKWVREVMKEKKQETEQEISDIIK